MSLHTLANHMSAHGRGPDSTLVHMSPREVQGLQALAMRHGGSLTINPQTGLPEAGTLEKLLPALAGFALNAFAPGIGGAVGSALGLTGGTASAVGTGLIVGGVTGLASGSLEKGLMAGLGGYGGAGLGSSLLSAGDAALAGPPVSASGIPGAPPPSSPVGTLDRLQAGVGVLGGAPVDALKNNALNIGLASAPVFMDSFGGDDKEETAAPKQQSGNLYMYKKDPATGQSYAYETYSGDEVKNAPPVRFGNAGGGLMQHYDVGGPVKFGNATDAVDANGNPITPATEKTISDSQRAQDYLLGKPGATNPFLFYSKGPAAAAALSTAPVAALSTAGISALMPESVGSGGTRGGLSFEQQQERDDPKAWMNLSDDQKSDYYIDNPGMLGFSEGALNLWSKTPIGMIQNYFDPSKQDRQRKIMESARGAIHARSFNAPIKLEPTPIQTPEQALENSKTFGIPLNQPPGAVFDINDFGENNDGSPSGNRGDGGDGGGGFNTEGGGSAAAKAARDGMGFGGAQGGFLDNGKFDQRYAHGGGITALAQGGMYNLGSYSDGGRLLRGPGDGVSDDIPATIGQNQPARLADGEFVVPARIVSELGNGSTEAGARKLYAMMDRVQKARSKTVGKNKVAANSRADKYLPV